MRGRRRYLQPCASELCGCPGHVETMCNQNDMPNTLRSQDLRRIHRVLVCVAGCGLRPSHGQLELALEALLHQNGFWSMDEDRTAGDEDRKSCSPGNERTV